MELSSTLVGLKLSDRGVTTSAFEGNLRRRIDELADDERHRRQFTREMRRFLPAAPAAQAFDDPNYWPALIGALKTGNANRLT